MANNLKVTAVSRNAALNALTALLNSGTLVGYTGTQPATADTAVSGTKLFTCTFNATAYGAASAGTATAGAIVSDTNAVAGGTVGYIRCFKTDGTTAVLDGSVGTSGADFNFDTLTISIGGTVACTSSTLSLPT